MILLKPSWRSTLAIACAVVLSGCASPDYNYTPIATSISEPAINSVNIAYVGDEMLRQGVYSEHDAIYLPYKVEVSWAYDLHAGYYIKMGEDKDTETYMPSKDNEGGMVDKAAIADPWRAVMTYKDTQELCVITAFNATSCKNNANFERRKKPILTHNSFQQTLIYSGKIGKKVNIGYREFSNSHARPAYNNDVEYDLILQMLLATKGLELRIIEATNQYIKYKVIQNFNKAAL